MKGLYLYFFLCMCIIYSSCNTNHEKEIDGQIVEHIGDYTIRYNEKKGIIQVANPNIDLIKYKVKLNNYVITSDYLEDEEKLSILSCLKSERNFAPYLSLCAVRSNNDLDLEFVFDNKINKKITYHIIPEVSPILYNVKFSGIGAKLMPQSKGRNIDEEIKSWLDSHHEVLDDYTYMKMKKNYQYLTEKKNNNFITKCQVPVVHSLENAKYTIQSDELADYYAVVACSSQTYIDNFVDSLQKRGYEGLSTNKSDLLCECEVMDEGYVCVFLLGINKDDSFFQIPLSLVAIDNSAPYYDINSAKNSPDSLKYRNGMKVILPYKRPLVSGFCLVQVARFEGNSIACNVTFRINYAGDFKSITIHRKGSLCYSFNSDLQPEDITKNANPNPFWDPEEFTCKMHLIEGNNEIPVTLEDYHGNKRDLNISLSADSKRVMVPANS